MTNQSIKTILGLNQITTFDGTEGFYTTQTPTGTPVNAAGIWSDLRTYMQKGQVSNIEFVIDGGGSALTTGIKGYLEIPVACTISVATLLADQTGSVVVDVFRCVYSAFAPPTHPASADKITASAPPTISSATKSQDSTLTGWTKTLAAGDILGFNVNSATTITRVTISLKVTT